MGVFKAYDIRGIYNKDFHREDAYKIGFHLAQMMKTDLILIGRDARVSSDEIFEYLARGINDAGVNVDDAGWCTTPYVYWMTAAKNYDCSVQITASHNPKEYNGLKVSKKYALPIGYDSGLNLIEQKMNEPIVPVAKRGCIRKVDFKQDYIAFLLQYKSDFSNLNISIDCSNGMVPIFIKAILGDQPAYIHDKIDCTFPNHEPNPLNPESIKDICDLVKKERSDIGIIFDGDADRVVFIDEKGNFIPPDLIIAVLAHYWLEERKCKGMVIQDIRTSKSVQEYIEKFGSQMYAWRVGRAYAAEKLREIDGIYGGELAGHYYAREFFYSDSALMTMSIVLGIIQKFKDKGVPISQLIKKIKKYENSGEINFKLDRKEEAMNAVVEYFAKEEKPIKIMDFDGYRMEFKNWWFNIRLSNTEPYLRFIAEATTKLLLEKKVAETEKIINSFK
ncbi:MAG: phosphomannomutase/phosphoglucomutase [Bacteroidales bacterium]|jgi:phosphomannomutase|nr:phosphomannomutase/phosphoglucomutase [Bacteroidales bacterium]